MERETGEDVPVLGYIADAPSDNSVRRQRGELVTDQPDGAVPVWDGGGFFGDEAGYCANREVVRPSIIATIAARFIHSPSIRSRSQNT